MDFIVGIVSINLVTQTNFVKFRESRNSHLFWGDRCPVDPKNKILKENLESCKII